MYDSWGVVDFELKIVVSWVVFDVICMLVEGFIVFVCESCLN